MRDIDWADVLTYDWLVEVWIPVALGIATVVVAVAAVKASNRAGELAEKVEHIRIEEERRRRAEEQRTRVLGMAYQQAQLLWTWFDLSKSGSWTGPRTGAVAPERDPNVARRAAEAALHHSMVPGAPELLELTTWDLAHQFDRLPEEQPDENDEYGNAVASDFHEAQIRARRARATKRFRDWGLDPFAAEQGILEDLSRAKSDPDGYLRMAPTEGS